MFSYLRLFSVLSLLAITAIAGIVGVSFRSLAADHIMHLVESQNAAVVQGYINVVWKNRGKTVLRLAHGTDLSYLRDNPDITQFAQDTVVFFQDVPLVRVNIYAPSGALVMTANINNHHMLMGEDASPNRNFVLDWLKDKNRVSSQILRHVPLKDNDAATLVQTIVPLAAGGGEGAVEVMSDISGLWNEMVNVQMYCTGGIVAGFLIFLCLLFLVSQRAEGIIARQHEANLELAATAAAAQAENQEKSQFLANVSHELRTPLNAIIGFSDILKTEVISTLEDKKYENYINDIHASGVHLLGLINDILDYSKAEAGKLELEVSEVNASKTVQNCMRLVMPRAESGEVKLVDALPKEVFTLVNDSKKFKQILLNLLSNAVKFTPPGGRVAVSAWHNMGDDSISFQVKDTGIGIAPKDISRAMAPFGQVDNALKRKYEGTGLGLPLTKKFVELMGGKFSIESEVNVGTTIVFTLPREIKQRPGIIIKHVS